MLLSQTVGFSLECGTLIYLTALGISMLGGAGVGGWLLRAFGSRAAWLSIFILMVGIFLLKVYVIPHAWPQVGSWGECIEPGNSTHLRCGFIFDESVYVTSARKMLYYGEASNNEHPPLAKWLIMVGMVLVGDNPYGWRLFPALLSSFSIFLLWLIAVHLTGSFKAAFIAAVLFAFDITSFNMGLMAILDPVALFFALLGALLLLKDRPVLAGVAFGLSILSKITGILALMAMLVYILVKNLMVNQSNRAYALKLWIACFVKAVLPAALVLMIGLAAYDYVYSAFPNPVDHLLFMLRHYSGYGAPFWWMHAGKNEPPITWVTPFIPHNPWNVYSSPVRLICFYLIRTPLWIAGWLVFALCLVDFVSKFKKGAFGGMELFFLSWFTFNYLFWFFVGYLIRKHIFPYYFYMTVPALALACNVLWRDATRKIILAMVIASQLFFFFAYFPVKNMELFNLVQEIGIPF